MWQWVIFDRFYEALRYPIIPISAHVVKLVQIGNEAERPIRAIASSAVWCVRSQAFSSELKKAAHPMTSYTRCGWKTAQDRGGGARLLHFPAAGDVA